MGTYDIIHHGGSEEVDALIVGELDFVNRRTVRCVATAVVHRISRPNQTNQSHIFSAQSAYV
jgi:hypothetical protein